MRSAAVLRRGTNGLVVAGGLLVALPLVALAGRLRPGVGNRVARIAVRIISRACGISYDVVGGERLEPGAYVFAPNHTSPVDIAAMFVARPDLRFAAASELFRVPLLGAAMRALRTIPVDRRRPAAARQALQRVAGRLRRGAGSGSIVVFPEGGIPPAGEQRQFKSGAFALAIEAGLPVVPVTITGSASVLPRGRRIWAAPGTIRVELHPPIPTSGLLPGDRQALRDQAERVVRGTPVGA